jgi:hypothetical protein
MRLPAKFKYQWTLAPMILSISFVVSIYEHNMSEIYLSALVIPMLAVIGIAGVFLFLSVFIFREEVKRSLFLSVLVVMAYSYGEITYLLERFNVKSLADDRMIFPLWIILTAIVFFVIKKIKKDLSSLAKFILLFSIIALLAPSLGIAKFEITERLMRPAEVSRPSLPMVDQDSLPDDLPDIYFIVPDSFASPAVLKRLFDLDVSPLVGFLEEKGFYVPDNHTSNYPKTYLSLTSTLNMEYLDYLSVNQNSSDLSLVAPLLSYHNAIIFLKNIGYKFYQMGSWWQFTSHNPMAYGNITLEGGTKTGISLFNYSILQSTILKPFLNRLISRKMLGNSDDDNRARNDFQFEELPRTADIPGPKFVFVHILSPHIPFVYGKNCESVSNPEFGKDVAENYADQVNCVSLKLKETIEKLLANSKKPPVIIIQSDEGVAYIRHQIPKGESWEKADDEFIKDKFPVFAAYYAPGVSTSTFAVSTTNVNTLRLIFNAYFNAGFDILPDRNYIFKDEKHSYDFIDVTDKIRVNK